MATKKSFSEKINKDFGLKWEYHEKFDITKLETHPMNSLYFRDSRSKSSTHGKENVEGNSFESLKASIKMTGVRDPLLVIFENDHYYVMSGNRRLIVSLELGIKHVPVRLCKTKINESLMKFIIIDSNTQRREFHGTKLSTMREQRIKLYFDLVPGLKQKLRMNEVTYKDIEEYAGSKEEAQKDLTKLKRQSTKELTSEIYGESGINEITIRSVKKFLGHIENAYETSNKATRQELSTIIRDRLRKY